MLDDDIPLLALGIELPAHIDESDGSGKEEESEDIDQVQQLKRLDTEARME